MDAARYAALFQTEARELLGELDAALLTLERGSEGPEAGFLFDSVFRAMHTIKGMAAAMGYRGVELLAHALESRCEPLRKNPALLDASTMACLFDGTYALRSGIDAIGMGREESHPAIRAMLRQLGAAMEDEPAPLSPAESNVGGSAVAPAATAAPIEFPVFTHQDSGRHETVVAARTVRMDARRLDTLLDLAGELVVTRDRLLRALEGMEPRDRVIEGAARDASRLITAVQEEILQARLLPASYVLDRFPRLVRDLARELGKSVSLSTVGREMELDRAVLEAIAEPMLHLVRNALDHGIEPPEVREAQGKPARAEITLRVTRDRAFILVQVQDDGRGIDRRAVLQRARERGIVGDDVTTVDDQQLLQLLAHPGFSTAATVTTLSGRGVGIDVVVTRVRALGGQVALESQHGAGACFTLRLPTTLSIARALLVELEGAPFAVPAAHVEEVLAWEPPATGDTPRMEAPVPATVTIREETMPLVPLRQRFALPASTAADQHLVVVSVNGRRTALLVDTLIAQQDIVVKPLTVVKGAKPWFSGATVLGDGRPALIVDVASVV